jgi:hypothetical protein
VSLSLEQLLAGGSATQVVDIPLEFLRAGDDVADAKITVRPLTVRDLQLIAGAVRDDDSLSAALMIQQAVVEPELRVEQISKMPAGLARFLVDRINAISGIDTPQNALEELVQAPLAKACFVLAKEFGWTPEAVSGMTIGQILLYLEMMRGNGEGR